MKDILIRLKKLRKDIFKMSQEEFGGKLGLSKSNISNIEVGRIELTDRNIHSICEKFNVSEEWLRYGQGEIFKDLSVEEEIAEFIGRVLKDKEDTFKKRYIEMLSKLDDSGWDALEAVAESYLKVKKD